MNCSITDYSQRIEIKMSEFGLGAFASQYIRAEEYIGGSYTIQALELPNSILRDSSEYTGELNIPFHDDWRE